MKLPFPLSLLFPSATTATVMGQFTAAIDKLEAIADREFQASIKAANKADAIFEAAVGKAEAAREAALEDYNAALKAIDKREEAEVVKSDGMDDRWEAHAKESDAARAAAETLRSTFGLPKEEPAEA